MGLVKARQVTEARVENLRASNAKLPRVSVVMPIRNEEAYIYHTLNQVLRQETAWVEPGDNQREIEFEVLVVDGCSTDQTPAIVAEFAAENPRVRLLNNPGKLSSFARNVGVENSTGDYVVIIDGHCEIPSQTYLVDLVRAFERTGADCLGRPQPLDVTHASNLQKAIAAARNSRLGHHPDSFIYSKVEIPVPAISVAVADRREVFDVVGIFDTRFDACEDCEFNHRIDQFGLSCFLVPELAIKYQPRNSLRSLFYQLARYGRGRVRLFRKHPKSFSVTALVPALFFLGVVIGPAICWSFSPLWYVYFGVIAIYLLAIAAFPVVSSSRPSDDVQGSNEAKDINEVKGRNIKALAMMPLVYLTIHLGSAWGVIRQAWSELTSRKIRKGQ